MGTLAPQAAKEAHVPQWEWVYIPVERIDFVVAAHDAGSSSTDEIYHQSQDFPRAMKLYYVSGKEMLLVQYTPSTDLPMSTFTAFRDSGWARTTEYTLHWHELWSKSLEELRTKFVLMAQVDIKEDLYALAFDGKRGYGYTKKLESMSEFVEHFMRGLTHLRQKHKDLKLA